MRPRNFINFYPQRCNETQAAQTLEKKDIRCREELDYTISLLEKDWIEVPYDVHLSIMDHWKEGIPEVPKFVFTSPQKSESGNFSGQTNYDTPYPEENSGESSSQEGESPTFDMGLAPECEKRTQPTIQSLSRPQEEGEVQKVSKKTRKVGRKPLNTGMHLRKDVVLKTVLRKVRNFFWKSF
jgi:hypothetical protein